MDYAELFDTILKEKGLSDRKASKETKKAGHEVAASYINQIRNRKSDPPSDDVSRAIAIICGKPEDLLVFQKYYDNAPKAFRDIIKNLRDTLTGVLITITDSIGNAERTNLIRDGFAKIPIAELITSMSTADSSDVSTAISGISSTDMLNANSDGYPVQDDAMSPTIPKGAMVYTHAFDDWAKYKDGDIFCYHKIGDVNSDNGNALFYVREIQFLNDEHTKFRTLPMNTSCPKETLTKEDVFLYGKVESMLVDFE